MADLKERVEQLWRLCVATVALIAGALWVHALRYEVQVFFTGQDPLGMILFAPILWIPGAFLFVGGLFIWTRALIELALRSANRNP